jgi:hypothetical protein
MTGSVVLKSLHLEYRVWIAELNFDINLIRIFTDRLIELKQEYKTETEAFDNKFNESRNTIDELRHRMHIEKMNLAALARTNNASPTYAIKVPDNYSAIRDDFFRFRISFNELKSDFLRFESKQ